MTVTVTVITVGKDKLRLIIRELQFLINDLRMDAI